MFYMSDRRYTLSYQPFQPQLMDRQVKTTAWLQKDPGRNLLWKSSFSGFQPLVFLRGFIFSIPTTFHPWSTKGQLRQQCHFRLHRWGMCFGTCHVTYGWAAGHVLPPCALWMKWTFLICMFAIPFTISFVNGTSWVSVCMTVSLWNEWSVTWHEHTWTFGILNNNPRPRPLLHILMFVQLPIPCFRFKCQHIYIILCHAISCCDS